MSAKIRSSVSGISAPYGSGAWSGPPGPWLSSIARPVSDFANLGDTTVVHEIRPARPVINRLSTVALALLLVGCGATVSPSAPSASAPPSASSAPSASAVTHNVLGTLDVAGHALQGGFGGCDQEAGLGAFLDGAPVVIKDEHETTIASSVLAQLTGPEQTTPCRFAFNAILPETGFYHVSFGDHDGPTISLADLSAAGWKWKMAFG